MKMTGMVLALEEHAQLLLSIRITESHWIAWFYSHSLPSCYKQFFYSTGTKWSLHNLFFFIKIVFLLSYLKSRNLLLKNSNLSLSSHDRNNFLWVRKMRAQQNYIQFFKRIILVKNINRSKTVQEYIVILSVTLGLDI